MFENSLKHPQSIYYSLYTAVHAWKRTRHNPQGTSSLPGHTEGWAPRGGMWILPAGMWLKETGKWCRGWVSKVSWSWPARKEIKNSKLGKSSGPRSTAWKEQLSMIWTGWSMSYWRWGKAREETDRESKEGSREAKAARPRRPGCMPQHSSGLPGAGVKLREDSVHPVYNVRAEMQDWVSMYMWKRNMK